MNITWKTCFRLCSCIFILYLCCFYWPTISSVFFLFLGALSPLLLGFSIAYVLNILMSFYELHYFPKLQCNKIILSTKRPLCLFGAILSLLGVVSLVVWLVVPELVSCVSLLISKIPTAIQNLIGSQWIRKVMPDDVLSHLAGIDWTSYITNGIHMVTNGLGNALTTVISAVSSVFSVIVSIVFGVIFSLYMLASKEKLQKQMHKLLGCYGSKTWNQKIQYVASVMNQCFHNYIVGQCIEAVILGGLCVVGMLVFGFPYATMIGALVGFCALIPVAGAFVGAGVGFLMIVTVSPIKALLFLVFFVVLQQLEGNLIYPKVVGGSIGLPAWLVLASVTVGGSLMGILGMLIGVPLAATVYRLLKEDVRKKEKAIQE